MNGTYDRQLEELLHVLELQADPHQRKLASILEARQGGKESSELTGPRFEAHKSEASRELDHLIALLEKIYHYATLRHVLSRRFADEELADRELIHFAAEDL